jgi:hypothetical protein
MVSFRPPFFFPLGLTASVSVCVCVCGISLTFGIEKSCHAVLAFHNVKGGFKPVADAAILQRAPIHQIRSAKEIRKGEKKKKENELFNIHKQDI